MEKSLIIIGGGPAGYVAAIRGAQLGAQVVLVERDRPGGTCLNRGCIPTKAMLELVHLAARAKELGASSPSVAFLREKAKEKVSRLSKGLEGLLHAAGVRIVQGTGVLVGAGRAAVAETGEELKANGVIIATGSKPAELHFLKDAVSGELDPESFQIPRSLVIAGGGMVGIELAELFSRLGVQVTILEMMTHILPGEDEELVQMLEGILKKRGIKILTGAKVIGGEAGSVKYLIEGKETTVKAEMVISAIGRRPAVEGLEKVGIRLDEGKVAVDLRLETSLPGVYAAGDVVGGVMLAHKAMAEGRCAAENALGGNSYVDRSLIPRCLYTSPELASVGLTEKEAAERHGNISVGRFPLSANSRAVVLGETEGLVKVISDKRHGEILGVHILGPGASELISVALMAIKLEATASELAHAFYPHPSLAEALGEASLDLEGKAIHFPRKNLR